MQGIGDRTNGGLCEWVKVGDMLVGYVDQTSGWIIDGHEGRG